MTDIIKAIIAIKSDAQVSVSAEDINRITWHDDNPTNITNEAILKIKSDAQVTVVGGDIDTCTITWHDDNPTNITKEQIKAKINETKYQKDRVYPSIGDQLDMLWHSIDQNTELKSQYFNFYEAIKSVKVKNPK